MTDRQKQLQALEANHRDNALQSIKSYSITELRSVAQENRHAVRDEVLRRHAIESRRLAGIRAAVAALEALAKEVM